MSEIPKWAAAVSYDRTDNSLVVMSTRIRFELNADLEFQITKAGGVNAVAFYLTDASAWPVSVADVASHSVAPGNTLLFPGGASILYQ